MEVWVICLISSKIIRRNVSQDNILHLSSSNSWGINVASVSQKRLHKDLMCSTFITVASYKNILFKQITFSYSLALVVLGNPWCSWTVLAMLFGNIMRFIFCSHSFSKVAAVFKHTIIIVTNSLLEWVVNHKQNNFKKHDIPRQGITWAQSNG